MCGCRMIIIHRAITCHKAAASELLKYTHHCQRPVMSSLGPPPLPPGWTEHVGMHLKNRILRHWLIFHTGPAGQPYYYHAGTQESTYIRPFPSFPIISQAIVPQPPKKKDKPLLKTPIPGTEWLRVKTTEGNIFYSHKVKKQSLWTVPDEIKDVVEAFERAEEHEN